MTNEKIVSPLCGGLGGNPHTIILNEGEYINEVRYHHGDWYGN